MQIKAAELSPLNQYLKRQWSRTRGGSHGTGRRISPQSLYLLASLLVLAASTAFWAVLSAHVEIGNADQLSDPYLFSNAATFHGAIFPSTHTFLLKWPIFW